MNDSDTFYKRGLLDRSPIDKPLYYHRRWGPQRCGERRPSEQIHQLSTDHHNERLQGRCRALSSSSKHLYNQEVMHTNANHLISKR